MPQRPSQRLIGGELRGFAMLERGVDRLHAEQNAALRVVSERFRRKRGE